MQNTDFELRRLVIDEFGKVSAAANSVDSSAGNWKEHGTIFSYIKNLVDRRLISKRLLGLPLVSSGAVLR
jgi:hypothetical protein